MNLYSPSDLVKMWAMEAITADQAIGQLLLHLEAMQKRIAALEAGEGRPMVVPQTIGNGHRQTARAR